MLFLRCPEGAKGLSLGFYPQERVHTTTRPVRTEDVCDACFVLHLPSPAHNRSTAPSGPPTRHAGAIPTWRSTPTIRQPNPAFRAQPARRSLLEFQTTGRSREDEHSLSAKVELYPARRSSSASQVRRAPRQPSGEGGSTRTILMRLVGTGALLNRYLGLKPQAESYCRFFGAGNPSPIVFHDSRSAKKLQTLTSQKS
jgi:hypothetical protein